MTDYVLKLRHTGSPCIGGGSGALVGEDVSFTLATQQDQTLFQSTECLTPWDVQSRRVYHENTAWPALYAGEGGGHGYAMAEAGQKYIIRRLTPVECERLQGFPDGYTDIPYKGKEHPTDTPRYKALGNSMAVPVMRWIGERIQMVEEIKNGLV